MLKTKISKLHSPDCEATVLTHRYSSFHVRYIPRGITPSLSHIHQVFDNSHAPTHPSSRLGTLDAASSDSVIRRRPAERGRVRTRRKRAQPLRGISKASHGSQLDGGPASPTAGLQGREDEPAAQDHAAIVSHTTCRKMLVIESPG